MVGAGMATYLPSREGIAQVGKKLLTSHSLCALPARSTCSRVETRPVGLLVTNMPRESAAQSTPAKPFQFLTVISRDEPVATDSKRIRLSSALSFTNASNLPSGERLQFQPVGLGSKAANWLIFPVT